LPFRTRSPGAGRIAGLAALGAAAGFAVLNPSLLPFLVGGLAAPFAIRLARSAGPVAGIVAAVATVVGVATALVATRPSEGPTDGHPAPPVIPPLEVVRVAYTGDARFDDGVGWRIEDRMLVPVAAVDEAVRDDLSGAGWRVVEREGGALVYARRRRVSGGLDTWPPASTIGLSSPRSRRAAW
jgi:hypothetical protein